MAAPVMTGCDWFDQRSSYTSADISIDALLNAHNNVRSDRHKSALRINAKLSAAAQKHAEWMASTGRFSHTGQGRSRPSNRVDNEGYKWSRVGENIAMGQGSIGSVMEDWMDSSGHRANILGNYTEVGFGIVKNSQGQIIWVAVFATPM